MVTRSRRFLLSFFFKYSEAGVEVTMAYVRRLAWLLRQPVWLELEEQGL